MNWEPPTYDPQTGLFYVATDETYSVFYRTEPNVGPCRALTVFKSSGWERWGNI